MSVRARHPEAFPPETLARMAGIRRASEADGTIGAAHGHAGQDAWSTGFLPLDDALGSGGLCRDGLHEIVAPREDHLVAAMRFTLGLVACARVPGPVIWCASEQSLGEHGQPYIHGLSRFGLCAAQFLFVPARKPLDLHFSVEEAIKAAGGGIVIAEGRPADFTGSRRLSLLARKHDAACLILCSEAMRGQDGSAALTRFAVRGVAGVENPLDPFGPGLATFEVMLTRNRQSGRLEGDASSGSGARSGEPYPWRMVFDEETLSFGSAAVFSRRAASRNAGAADDDGPALPPYIRAIG